METAPPHSHRQARAISEGDVDFFKSDACKAVKRELPALAVVEDPLYDLGKKRERKC